MVAALSRSQTLGPATGPEEPWPQEASQPDVERHASTGLGGGDQLVFKGSFLIEEVSFLHRATRTVILGDFIQRQRPMPRSPIGTWLKKMRGIRHLRGGLPIDVKASFVFNRSEGRRSLEKLLSWDFDQLIIAHGECVRRDARHFAHAAIAWLG